MTLLIRNLLLCYLLGNILETFPQNKFGEGHCDGVASSRIDNTTIYSDNPSSLAESSPNQAFPLVINQFTLKGSHFPLTGLSVQACRRTSFFFGSLLTPSASLPTILKIFTKSFSFWYRGPLLAALVLTLDKFAHA